MWTGTVYMGMSQTNMSVVFDTGSDWMVVQGSTCVNCEGGVFNADASGKKTNTTLQNRAYGSANLTGYTYKDIACLTSTLASCVMNFEYFSVTHQDGLSPPIEGIVGLSQNKQFLMSNTQHVVGPLFV